MITSERVLFFWAFNPLHNWHLKVINILRGVAKRVDVYVGNSDRSWGRLSYNTRLKLGRFAIEGMDNCFISDAEKLEQISELDYKSIAFGSDLLRLRDNYWLPDKPFSTQQWNMFKRFQHVFIFNRMGHLIWDKERQYIQELQSSTILESGSPLTGRGLRERFCRGEDISADLPNWIFSMIRSEAETVWKK